MRHPFRSPLLSLALASLALPVLAGPDRPATEERVHRVTATKVVLADGADAGAFRGGVMLERTSGTDEEPRMMLRVLGSDTAPIDVLSLPIGESRSFPLGEGRWLDVVREDDVLQLDLDGKEISLPLAPVGAGGDLDHHVVAIAGDAVAAAPTGLVFLDEERVELRGVGDHALQWTGAGAATPGHDVKVIVARPRTVDFDSLESLQGLDAETRERVIAALQEILGQPGELEVQLEKVDDPDARRRLHLRHPTQQ